MRQSVMADMLEFLINQEPTHSHTLLKVPSQPPFLSLISSPRNRQKELHAFIHPAPVRFKCCNFKKDICATTTFENLVEYPSHEQTMCFIVYPTTIVFFQPLLQKNRENDFFSFESLIPLYSAMCIFDFAVQCGTGIGFDVTLTTIGRGRHFIMYQRYA